MSRRIQPRLLIPMLGFASIAVLGALVALWVYWDGYRQRSAMQLDPVGLGRFLEKPDRPDGKLVVFFGDSRIAQWPTPKSVSGMSVINRGISGQTSAQILGRLQPHVLALKPDIVVIQAGINDLKAIALFPEQAEDITNRCIENVRTIVDRLIDSGAIVVLTTIFPHARVPLYRRLVFTPEIDDATRRVNVELEMLSSPRVLLLRSDTLLGMPSGLIRPEFSRNLLHVTPAGYEALNLGLAPLLEQACQASGKATDEPGAPTARAPLEILRPGASKHEITAD